MSDWSIHFCPHCGTPTEIRTQFGEPHPTCPACGWIHFDDPKVAAAVLVEQDGRVLLTRRINEPYRGSWSLPAGFVNAGEHPARAAERECREETGLEVQAVELYDLIAGREHERGADLLLVYRARMVGGALRAGDDADDAAFFERGALPPLAFQTTGMVLRGEERFAINRREA